ncbi:MAG: hypothetical protein FWH37_10175 [Candidatus Bathyarchaeota archaeon]|nr:hypothetical protein [Candidatus Termiticorpusculum sp.]
MENVELNRQPASVYKKAKIRIGTDITIYPYYDLVAFCGQRGSGKSYFSKTLVRKIQRVIVWDINREYSNDHEKHVQKVCHSLKDVKDAYKNKYFDWQNKTSIAYQPQQSSYTEFDELCEYIYYNLTYVCLVVEEIGKFDLAHQPKDSAFKAIVDTGRHQGVGCFCLARRAKDIPYYLMSSATHIFSFNTNRPEDIKYADDFLGDEYQSKLQNYIKNESGSPHSFCYFDGEKIVTTIHKPLSF